MNDHMKILPKFALRMISRLEVYENHFSLTAGIEEEYSERLSKEGNFRSGLWFWSQIFGIIIQYFVFSVKRSSMMFKNHLKTGYRNFTRQKMTSAINVAGLTLGLSCSILILLFIGDEISFDRFHKRADSIYSVVNRDNYYEYTYRFVPNGLGPTMEEFFEEIDHSIRVSGTSAVVRYNEKIFREECSLVDPEFFQVFSFDLITGNPENVLVSDNSIVLTESSAQKYFGDDDPIGKIIEIQVGQWIKLFEVAGIVENVPDNSTIEYDFVMNIRNL
ncbi:MAG: ABC transporter permease, partial [bacterium]|nr:ABC transporter permease [bacterium]